MRIYNSDNNLVFDDVSNIDIQPEHDKISMGWILKGKDGSFVPSGKYRLVCSINNSPPFTYFFTVTSDQEVKPAASPQGSVLGFIKKMFDL